MEVMDDSSRSICELAIKHILIGTGNDVNREGLKDTPRRYVKFLEQFFNPAPYEFTTFSSEAKGTDDMVLVGNIPFYSMCEHHLAPFFGEAFIAYIPNGKIVGLSKIPRLLDEVARKPQNQERITTTVADELMSRLQPKGVGVVIKARHMCIEMRGVEKPGTMTTTSCMLGVFREDVSCRQEFLSLIK